MCLNLKYTKNISFLSDYCHNVGSAGEQLKVNARIKIYQNTNGHDFFEIKENNSVLMTNFLLPDDQITGREPRRIQPIISQILRGIDTQTIV